MNKSSEMSNYEIFKEIAEIDKLCLFFSFEEYCYIDNDEEDIIQHLRDLFNFKEHREYLITKLHNAQEAYSDLHAYNINLRKQLPSITSMISELQSDIDTDEICLYEINYLKEYSDLLQKTIENIKKTNHCTNLKRN